MDLKQGLELLKSNKTFKSILSTLLSIGIFLNGAPVKGFQVEYLAKVRFYLNLKVLILKGSPGLKRENQNSKRIETIKKKFLI